MYLEQVSIDQVSGKCYEILSTLKCVERVLDHVHTRRTLMETFHTCLASAIFKNPP